MRKGTTFSRTLAVGLLVLLSACGNGSGTPAPAPAAATPATRLTYADPPGAGWRLVRDASSTATHLVLSLVGPDQELSRGVGFNLESNGSVRFARMPSGKFVQDAGVFLLRNQDVPEGTWDPVLFFGGVQQGGRRLSVGLFQKDRRQPSRAVNVPLLQVAIDLDPALGVPAGKDAGLVVGKARSIPDDIGTMPADPAAFDADYRTVIARSHATPVEIAVGSLVLE